MGTIDRIKLLVRANINDAIQKAEDPAKVSGLMVEEMRDSVRSIKRYLASAIVDLKRMEKDAEAKAQEAARWQERAVLAVGKNEEELARKALAQKKACEEIAQNIRAQIPTQQTSIQSLREDLQRLETQLDDLRQKYLRLVTAQEYKAKRPVVERTVPASEDLILDTSTLDSYERMVQKVEDMEAMSAAIAELTQGDELERKFEALEKQQGVEEELTALKQKLKGEASEN